MRSAMNSHCAQRKPEHGSARQQAAAKARGYKEKQGKCQDLPPIYHLACSTASSFALFPFAPNHWQFRQRYKRCSEPRRFGNYGMKIPEFCLAAYPVAVPTH